MTGQSNKNLLHIVNRRKEKLINKMKSYKQMKQKLRIIRWGNLIVMTILFSLTSQAQQDTKPNIVFILTDDLGYTDLGCYGNPYNQTPHIDALAERGMKFQQAYVASPICSPSRAAIMTGKHPARLHLTNFLVGERTDPYSPLLPAQWRRADCQVQK